MKTSNRFKFKYTVHVQSVVSSVFMSMEKIEYGDWEEGYLDNILHDVKDCLFSMRQIPEVNRVIECIYIALRTDNNLHKWSMFKAIRCCLFELKKVLSRGSSDRDSLFDFLFHGGDYDIKEMKNDLAVHDKSRYQFLH